MIGLIFLAHMLSSEPCPTNYEWFNGHCERAVFNGEHPSPSVVCVEHEWVTGPYYLTVAYSYEEPVYYSPGGMVRVEFCKKCGVVRVDPKFAGCENVQTCGAAP